jgi:hypothetical protein
MSSYRPGDGIPFFNRFLLDAAGENARLIRGGVGRRDDANGALDEEVRDYGSSRWSWVTGAR